MTDQASGNINLVTASGSAPFSLSALTTYTNTNLATGGASTDNDLYSATTALTGNVAANAVLVRGDGITLSGAFTLTPTTGEIVMADTGNTGNSISANPNFGGVEGILITANTGSNTGGTNISGVIPSTSRGV